VSVFRSALTIAAFSLCLQAVPALGDWQTRCEGDRCQLVSEILGDDKKVQAGLIVHNADAENAKTKKAKNQREIVIVMLPLGIHIPAGVTVQIDKTKPFKAELVDCRVDEGCRAAFDFTSEMQSLMKGGRQISFAVIDARNKRKVTFNFSLMKFTDAYKEFTEKARTANE